MLSELKFCLVVDSMNNEKFEQSKQVGSRIKEIFIRLYFDKREGCFKNDYNCDITYGMDTSNLILITVRIEDYSCDIMKILDKISDKIDIINDTPIMVLLTTDFRYKK